MTPAGSNRAGSRSPLSTLSVPLHSYNTCIAVPKGIYTFIQNHMPIRLARILGAGMIATVLSMSGLSDSLIWDLQTAHAATLSASPSTVPGGGIATATVTGGPGGTGDFVGLYALGAPNWSVFNYLFLNDSTVPSATGLTSGTLHFTMPSIPGTYEFRLFPGTFDTALATSNPITVPSAVPVSLSADPSSITLGDISMLAWGSSNATSCTGANFTPTGVAGKVTVIPSTTTTYSVTCTGPQGSYSTSTTVSVSPVITTPIINFVASQTSITSGLSSTLAWHATNATSCSGSGFSTGGLTLGSVTVTPSAN